MSRKNKYSFECFAYVKSNNQPLPKKKKKKKKKCVDPIEIKN